MQTLAVSVMGAHGTRTHFLDAAYALDGDRKKPYWRVHTELFARVFESWVSDELDGLGRKNEFLVYGCAQNAPADHWGLGNEPYPKGQERTQIVTNVRAFAAAVSIALSQQPQPLATQQVARHPPQAQPIPAPARPDKSISTATAPTITAAASVPQPPRTPIQL